MNLVDASGWLEYLADGPQAGFFAKPLADPGRVLVPTLILHEVFGVIAKQRSETPALEVLACMKLGRVIPLDADIAVESAHLGLRHGLSFADSVVLATTVRHRATLWTQNAAFKDIPGVQYLARTSRV